MTSEHPIPDRVPSIVAEDGDAIDVYYEVSGKFLDVQMTSIDSLDSKANTALSIGSAILPLSLGIIRAINDDPSQWVLVALCPAVAAYVVLAISWGVATYGKNEVEYRPDIPTTRENMDAGLYSADVLKLWVATEREVSIEINDEIMRHKARYVGIAEYALVVESVSLAVAGSLGLMLG